MDVCPPSSQADSRACCPRCGGTFDCGGMTQPFGCWCRHLPALPIGRAHSSVSAVAAAGCLCPACFAQALAAAGNLGDAGARDNPTD